MKMKIFFKGKSKFYREFMINLIKDILAIVFGSVLFIGTVWGIIYIIRL